MGQKPGDPGWVSTSLELTLHGHWDEAGTLKFHFADVEAGRVKLPPTGMALVVLLVNSALDADDWSEAHLSANRLVRLSKQHGLGLPLVANRITNVVYEVRQLLAAADWRALRLDDFVDSGRDFAKCLLHRDETLGYRIALPPANLHLPDELQLSLPVKPPSSTA